MPTAAFLADHPVYYYTVCAVAGLCAGSFLNVVIYRLPRMLERQWREQCRDDTAKVKQTGDDPTRYNLALPRSHCPRCRHPLPLWLNIPVLSYLLSGGRCHYCKAAISICYPLVEMITASAFVLIAMRFGVSKEALSAMLLSAGLIALAAIDLEHQILPDLITLPLVWLGLLINLGNTFTDIQSAVLGATAGYLVLWLIYQLFLLFTGKHGMGYGDFKLLAICGAWLGWQLLPLILLLAASAGAIAGIGLIAMRGHDRHAPVSFGPFLAAACWLTLWWSNGDTGYIDLLGSF